MIILSQDHMSIYNTDDIHRIFVNKSSIEYVVQAEKYRMDARDCGNITSYPAGLVESHPLGKYADKNQVMDVITDLSVAWASRCSRFVMPESKALYQPDRKLVILPDDNWVEDLYARRDNT